VAQAPSNVDYSLGVPPLDDLSILFLNAQLGSSTFRSSFQCAINGPNLILKRTVVRQLFFDFCSTEYRLKHRLGSLHRSDFIWNDPVLRQWLLLGLGPPVHSAYE